VQEDCVVSIDVRDFLKELPSLSADPATGKAAWLSQVPRRMVLGATNDNIVDREGVKETGEFIDVTPVIVENAHDVMLGPVWARAADEILQWLEK